MNFSPTARLLLVPTVIVSLLAACGDKKPAAPGPGAGAPPPANVATISISAWTTTDRKHFTRKTLQIGQRQGNMIQILSGLEEGEQVVSDGAIFLSNEVTINALD